MASLLQILLSAAEQAQWSFEDDSFEVSPGYADENGARINGWTYAGRVGLASAGDSSFADNGAIPDGKNVAFLESSGAQASLSCIFEGLDPGVVYTVRFRANFSSLDDADVPSATWSLNHAPPVPLALSRPVGGSNSYRLFEGSFKASASSASLTIINNSAPKRSVLLIDDFSIFAGDGRTWDVFSWSGNSTSGHDPAHALWTWAARDEIVSSSGVTVAPAHLDADFEWTGYRNIHFDYNEIVNSEKEWDEQDLSLRLAHAFCLGLGRVEVTLTNLEPGRNYRVTFYGSPLDGLTPRPFTFSDDTTSFTVDESLYGPRKSMRVEHHFTARGRTHPMRIEPHSGSFLAFRLNGIALAAYDYEFKFEIGAGGSVGGDPMLLSPHTLGVTGVARLGSLGNPGSETLRISSAKLEGENPEEFLLTIPELPAEVPPGGELPFEIAARPLRPGKSRTIVRISTDHPSKGSRDFILSSFRSFAGETYGGWASRFFGLNAEIPEVAGNDADPDGDGIPNVLEYVLQRNPVAPNSPPLSPPVPDTYFSKDSLRFTIPKAVMHPQVRYHLQFSGDLSVWTDVARVGTTSWGDGHVGILLPGVYSYLQTADAWNIHITSDSPLESARPAFWRLAVK